MTEAMRPETLLNPRMIVEVLIDVREVELGRHPTMATRYGAGRAIASVLVMTSMWAGSGSSSAL